MKIGFSRPSILILTIAVTPLLWICEAKTQEKDSEGEAPKPMKGFRFTKDPGSPSVTSPDSPAEEEAESPASEDGSLKLGIVKGQTKLPPELADLAQQGALAVSAQKWDEARDLYLEMIEKAPDNALAYANLGVAEHQSGNLLAAAGNLKKSLELNPTISQNWQTLGLIQFERGDLNLAISSLTRAIHESPRNARARVYLAAVVRDYGWPEAALTELQRAIDIDPKLPDAHYNLAITYLEMEPPRLELARRHYYSALDLGEEPSPEIEAVFAQGE